jgi:hypothetical protein
MSPRALLTAIGATAIAFAVAIGAISGSVSSQTAPVQANSSMTITAKSQVAQFTLLANQDCAIAV